MSCPSSVGSPIESVSSGESPMWVGAWWQASDWTAEWQTIPSWKIEAKSYQRLGADI